MFSHCLFVKSPWIPIVFSIRIKKIVFIRIKKNMQIHLKSISFHRNQHVSTCFPIFWGGESQGPRSRASAGVGHAVLFRVWRFRRDPRDRNITTITSSCWCFTYEKMVTLQFATLNNQRVYTRLYIYIMYDDIYIYNMINNKRYIFCK